MLQYFVKWKGYPKSDNTWEPAQNVHAPDLLKKYHQRYPLQDKKGRVTQKKVSSRLRTGTTCQMPRTNLLPISPTNSLSLHRYTTTQSHLPPNFPSMSRGKSSAKPPSAMRRNRSPSHHVPGSMSSTTATAPLRMQLRSLRGSRPPSRTGRASTSPHLTPPGTDHQTPTMGRPTTR